MVRASIARVSSSLGLAHLREELRLHELVRRHHRVAREHPCRAVGIGADELQRVEGGLRASEGGAHARLLLAHA
eukprot:scaffold62260_cov30-Phaeocystis_antarctica.AAC.1